MKRVFDCIVCILVALPATLVVSILAAVGCILEGRPVFFTQNRVGHDEKIFLLYKFRTMSNRWDAAGMLLPDAERLTRWGGFLRRSSLDELPQLWNVLRGDMSLVGPRPLLVQYLDRYTPEQRRRHLVRPGITGLAQIQGRNALSWEQKFILDVQYIDERDLALDLKILCLTVLKVIRREGISERGQATMSEFKGSAIREQTMPGTGRGENT